MLTKTVKFPVSNTSSLFVLLIDGSKVSDNISHIKLFEILDLLIVVLRTLFNVSFYPF